MLYLRWWLKDTTIDCWRVKSQYSSLYWPPPWPLWLRPRHACNKSLHTTMSKGERLFSVLTRPHLTGRPKVQHHGLLSAVIHCPLHLFTSSLSPRRRSRCRTRGDGSSCLKKEKESMREKFSVGQSPQTTCRPNCRRKLAWVWLCGLCVTADQMWTDRAEPSPWISSNCGMQLWHERI